MPTRSSFCSLVLVPLLFTMAAAGQQPNAAQLQAGPKQQPPTRSIQLDVTVTPKSGAAVAGLQEKDFTVLDNKAPQTITSFRAFDGSQEPVEAILLIDSVNTSFSDVAYERQQIDKFLHADGGQLAYPLTLAVFSDAGVKIQPSASKDGNALAKDIDQQTIGLRTITRSTGIYGADERFQLSINALRELAAREATRPGRKIILWVSPGWPLLSGPGIDLTFKQEQSIFEQVVAISTQLRQAQITLDNVNPLGVDQGLGREFYYQQYLPGVSKPGQANIADLGLQVLATHSGGQVLSSTNIAGALKSCLADNRAYYRLSFEPPPAEKKDEYHDVEIKVGEPGLTARTSTGYYSQP